MIAAALLASLAAVLSTFALSPERRKLSVALALILGLSVWQAPGLALVLSTLLVSILWSQPLFVVLGLATLVAFEYFSSFSADYSMFPEKIYELSDKNVLLAIPFFVLSGSLMTHGSIAKKLIAFAQALTRGLPGGLALAGIGGCVLFAAISGSSPVTVIAIGTMMYPALIKDGFGERDAIGLLTSAGSLGIVIPPSIPMILYAIVVSGQQVIEVGELFLAGLGPGLLIGGLLASYVIAKSIRAADDPRSALLSLGRWLLIALSPILIGIVLSFFIGPKGYGVGLLLLGILAIGVAFRAFIDGFWALMLPVLIIGGIYTVMSPTQAAAVSVVYALVVETLIYRELSLKDIPNIVRESTVMMGALIMIMVIAFVFNDFLVEEEVPSKLVAWIEGLELSRVSFLLAVNILLLVVGFFMDILSAILIVAPLLVPMASALGIDAVHLGIIFIVNLELGYLTPPLGLNLFVSSTLFKKPVGEVVRAVVPYGAMMLIGILMITYLPGLALGPGEWLKEVRTGGIVAPAPQETPKKVLSIEELMQQAENPGDTIDEDSAEKPKVLSIEELMQQADQHKAQEADTQTAETGEDIP